MSANFPGCGEADVLPDKYPSLEEKIRTTFDKLNTQHQLVLIKLRNARVQTMGDLIYTINASISFDGQQTECILKQLEQPYKGYQEMEVNCPDKYYRAVIRHMGRKSSKRTAGDDSNSKSFAELAELIAEALVKLGKQEHIYYSLSRIEDVEHKVASGSKYFIKARLIKSNLKMVRCDLRIWEQPWRDFWDFTIRCANGRVCNVVKGEQESGDVA